MAFLLLIAADDCIPVLVCLMSDLRRVGRKPKRTEAQSQGPVAERRIAVFVPCWREFAVLENMVRRNLAAVRYANFDFFLGVYPNDRQTVEVAEHLAAAFQRVHVAVCGNPGPTSKADCLNWAYRRMEALEIEQSVRFDTVVLHDAEDLMHPLSLALINRERAHYEMVQVPVLPLPTGLQEITHGVYCDEFAEFQTIDMRARQLSGSFVPSNGVGTGFARHVLDRLAEERAGVVFDAASLTEDYEIGVRMHQAGYRQIFAPLARSDGEYVATREYFPRTTKSAIRQRTRWVTGIALQCWERQGWRGSWRTRYWFWRDRKGLVTNPLSALANVLFVIGLVDYALARAIHQPWLFEIHNPVLARLCWVTLAMQCFRVVLRAACVGSIYGAAHALTVLPRAFYANVINCQASLQAVNGYWAARRRKTSVTWQKTDHDYPDRDTLPHRRRELSEVLLACGYVSAGDLERARLATEATASLALVLLSQGLLNEEQLCQARSMQSGLRSAKLDPHGIADRAIRALPTSVQKRYGVVPVGVKGGRLLVVSAAAPAASAVEEISTLSRLPVEFQLVQESVYEALAARADIR